MQTPFNHLVPKEIGSNLRWRKRLLQYCADDTEFAAAVYQACSEDILFFLNAFGWTFNSKEFIECPRRPFILYEFQEEAVLDLVSAIGHSDRLIEKSRQMGASWFCVAVFTWFWLFRYDLTFLFVSRKEEYVDEAGDPKCLFWKFDYLIENLPYWMKPVGYIKGKHRKSMHAENPETRSVVDGESTNKDISRGDNRTAILMDEFGAVEENGELALTATRDATNCRIFNSTPRGAFGAFYKIRQTNIKKLRIHWTAHPLKSIGLYNKEGGTYNPIDKKYWKNVENYNVKMAELDSLIIARGVPLSDEKLRSPWYANECDREVSARAIAQEVDIDYLGSGGQFFDSGVIQKRISETSRDPFFTGDLEYDSLTGDIIGFRENYNGHFKLWIQISGDNKPSIAHKIAIGNDIAAGTGASNSCAAGWDCLTGIKVFEYTNPRIRPEAFATQMKAIADWFGNACMCWESGGPGRQFGDRIIELGYKNFYLRQREEGISKKTTDIPGVAQTRETKGQIISTYRDAIERGEAINYSKEALEDHLEYIYGPDGYPIHVRAISKDDSSGAKTNHGDRTMADALAWKMVKYASPRKIEPEKPSIPHGCLAWRNKLRDKQKQMVGIELTKGWI